MYPGLLNSRSTLRILDIEHSVMVGDEVRGSLLFQIYYFRYTSSHCHVQSVPLLSQLTQLTSLAISKTRLSSEGHSKLLTSLSRLQLLPRGDFLCDALGNQL